MTRKQNREPELTFADAMEAFIKDCEIRLKPFTIRRYKLSKENILKHFNGEISLDRITPIDIENFIHWRMEAGNHQKGEINGRKLRPATINRDLQFLRNFYNRIIKWNHAKINPMNSIDMLSEDNIITRVLSKEEINKILDESAHRKNLNLFVKMALYMGMRKEEILSLQLPEEDILNIKTELIRKRLTG